MKTSQFGLLRQRRFLPLFVTQFLGAFNDNVFKNALVVLITYRLAAALYGYNAQIVVTEAAGIFILPFFLFSATAGQLADKYEKSRLIPYVKLWEIILMCIATIGFFLQNVPLLMLVLFMLGVQATFFGPLKYAILPEALAEKELIAGNGLIEAGTFLAILLGTLFGGLLILMVHGITWISVAIIGFAVCGWGSSLFIPESRVQSPELAVNYNFLVETWRVMRYALQRKEIFIAIIGISWFWLVGATFLAEFPVFVKNSLRANQEVVVFFITLFSVGIGLGSLICNRLLRSEVRVTYVPWGALGITLFTLDLYFAAAQIHAHAGTQLTGLKNFLNVWQGWRITIDLILIAASGGIFTVPLYALLQKLSDVSYRARIIASNNIMNALFMTIAAVATVFMLKAGMSVDEVFLTVALVNIVVGLYICRLL